MKKPHGNTGNRNALKNGRDTNLNIRISKHDRDLFKNEAKLKGCSLADFVIDACKRQTDDKYEK